MKFFLMLAIVLSAVRILLATDGSDGPNYYAADFAREPSQYKITENDKRWAESLKQKLKEPGKIVYLTRTDLPLTKDGVELRGLIYRRIGEPQHYYIAEGDVILDLKKDAIYTPSSLQGVVMRSPRSGNFIVCFSLTNGGYRVSRHSEIGPTKVWWFADGTFNRINIQ